MIRKIKLTDAIALSEYLCKNKDHFRKWEPIRDEGYHSIDSCISRIQKLEETTNTSSVFFIYTVSNQIIGHCELSQIIYGPFRACYMGYGISKEYEGMGKAYELCKHSTEYAFHDLGLNRVMANYMPVNERSGNLLKKLGFQKEGLARKYLKIAGNWEDHVLTSLLNPSHVI